MVATESDNEAKGADRNAGRALWRRLRFESEPQMPFGDPAGRLVVGVLTCLLPYPFLGGDGMGRVLPWLLLTSFFGAAMIVSAIWQIRRNARFQEELERAIAEWDVLSREAYRADRDGLNLSRLLRERGYRDFFLRRWLKGLLTEQELSDEWRREADVLCPPPPVRDPSPAMQSTPRQLEPDDKTWRNLRDRERPMGSISNPMLRIAMGVLLLVGAVALAIHSAEADAAWWRERSPSGSTVACLAGALGIWMAFSGRAQLRRDHRVRQELERARDEWYRLEVAAATARERGESFVRELQERGYREYFVRRWLIARLQPESERPDPGRSKS